MNFPMMDALIPGAASLARRQAEVVSAGMDADFRDILQSKALTPLYQPIVDVRSGDILGYEGLIRGPADSSLHEPTALFKLARLYGKTVELECLCLQVHIDRFVQLGLAGKLFLNVSPEAMVMSVQGASPLAGLVKEGIKYDSIVLELTETDTTSSYALLKQAVADHRQSGLQIALDDLGEGFSSLRLWSELRPDYVKIDRYFIKSIGKDPVKRQFVRSICEIAQQSRTKLIAEGIETEEELDWVRSLGIPYGQGYFLHRPALPPALKMPEHILELMGKAPHGRRPLMNDAYKSVATARKILRIVPAVADTAPTTDVYNIFQAQDDLQVLAVLRNGAPIGLIHRLRLLERLARPYHRELYGNKPCAQFIENQPLIVDHQTSLQNLGHLIAEATPHHLSDGFIITEQGRYLGVGTGFDLIREITQMQIHAARYANPLTQLPGNVPINEHIEALLESESPFAVCYVDLDNFKPFNDLYSYRKGDEIIQITAKLLRECADVDVDFVGHIGGDDFIVVFKSQDWSRRCQLVLDRFSGETAPFYRPEHVEAGGYVTENRQGVEVFHPLISISLGVVKVNTALPYSSYQIAEFAALAKSEAKKIAGNSLFIERRSLLAGTSLSEYPDQAGAASH
ncbi:GGDEF domain-containing protein [Pusillimonas sp. SM2304]|uniref:GGDEF domain-containing protein n=1 Tax=Pusillimonas sp. SM2304 TaxID=3073241 RepID=UPI002875504F|nr:GGDEF domain-containing protein [Pusillimonas sp. SM2304]MDS1140224.1 GGDEF domain-containing protein [Pusillimonas sp. SM2304]